MRSLHQKWSIKSMILFWMTRKWKCVRWLRSYPPQLSVWSIFCIHIWGWKNSMQDGCCDCSQSSRNAFVWSLWSKIWPTSTANPKEFLHRFVFASIIWDAHEVIFIDYLEKSITITGAYYTALVDRLVYEIRKKRPHLKKKMRNRRVFWRVLQIVLFGRHRKVKRSLESL